MKYPCFKSRMRVTPDPQLQIGPANTLQAARCKNSDMHLGDPCFTPSPDSRQPERLHEPARPALDGRSMHELSRITGTEKCPHATDCSCNRSVSSRAFQRCARRVLGMDIAVLVGISGLG